MGRSVTMIHTVSSLVPTFEALARELLIDTEVFHVVDESLLTVTRRLGRLTPQTRRRLLDLATAADDQGVDGILVTCSSVGPIVELARPFLRAPIVRVDEAMVEAAVGAGQRIGVLATLRSTLEPTRDLIAERGSARGIPISIAETVVDGAFEAVVSGDVQRHDALVTDALVELAARCDVIVLAQASIARVVGALEPGQLTVPILSSPRLAVERLWSVISRSEAAA